MMIESELFIAKYERLYGDLMVLEALLYAKLEC
jgi:hypothetical protein